MDRLSDIIKWLEQIKDCYGDLPVLKEENKGCYTDVTFVITSQNIRFKYRYQSPSSSTGENEKIMIGPIVEIY